MRFHSASTIGSFIRQTLLATGLPRRTAGDILKRNGHNMNRTGNRRKKLSPQASRRIARHIISTQGTGGTTRSHIKATLGLQCSLSTIGRTIKKSGFKCVSRLEKGVLSATSRAARLAFAVAHVGWAVATWRGAFDLCLDVKTWKHAAEPREEYKRTVRRVYRKPDQALPAQFLMCPFVFYSSAI